MTKKFVFAESFGRYLLCYANSVGCLRVYSPGIMLKQVRSL